MTLTRGEEIKLSGFGNFILRDKRARPGRNPKTEEPSEISVRRVATFHESPILKSIAMGCREMEGVGTDLSGTAWVLCDGIYARARAVANFPGATTIVVN
ncbi:HU family DNA-binding protein [Acidithiobacillus sp.]|uniref:HU family DNA-binding protein n=1 Tax=Acidithiobacillus sp. TaxID=1872118 RepID=UPI003D06B083